MKRNKKLRFYYYISKGFSIDFKIEGISFELFMAKANFREGPLLVWHGERDIATIINEAGEYSKNNLLSNMFDDNPNTMWHSGGEFNNKPKSLKIQFRVSPILLKNTYYMFF